MATDKISNSAAPPGRHADAFSQSGAARGRLGGDSRTGGPIAASGEASVPRALAGMVNSAVPVELLPAGFKHHVDLEPETDHVHVRVFRGSGPPELPDGIRYFRLQVRIDPVLVAARDLDGIWRSVSEQLRSGIVEGLEMLAQKHGDPSLKPRLPKPPPTWATVGAWRRYGVPGRVRRATRAWMIRWSPDRMFDGGIGDWITIRPIASSGVLQ